MNAKEIVKFASELKDEDLVWKPYYPNNMEQNGVEGVIAVISFEDSKMCGEPLYVARKYTVKYQFDQNGEIEYYNLFEKSYDNLTGDMLNDLVNPPYGDCEVNDHGTFIRTFSNEKEAKERALFGFKGVFAYAMSFMLPGADENI